MSSSLATPKEQLDRVWSSILAHNRSTDKESPRKWPSYDELLSDMSGADYTETLQCPHDLRILGAKEKRRTLCPHGVVCKARLELFPHDTSHDSDYTGILTPGNTAEHCILRLSSAMKPPSDEITSRMGRIMLYAAGKKLRQAKLFPTAAIKVFRGNGAPSGNLLFGGCKVGQPEEDFFAHCLCTQLTERVPRTVKPFIRKFWQYSDYPLSLGISEFCTTNQSGENTDHVQFPYVLILRPRKRESDLTKRDATSTNSQTNSRPKDFESFDSFLDSVLDIPVGTALYDLFACPNPESVPDPSKLERIGQIVTTSEMVQSGSEDGLFFRHQQKEDDYKLRPEWKESVKQECSLNNGSVVGAVSHLAGWELFEEHIQRRAYIDYEASSLST